MFYDDISISQSYSMNTIFTVNTNSLENKIKIMQIFLPWLIHQYFKYLTL